MRKHKLCINGKEVTRKEFFANAPAGGSGTPMLNNAFRADRPLVSDALGCLPHQVAAMREAVQRRGLSAVRVLDDGRVEISSRGDAGRNGLLRMRGAHDNDAGYGDHAGNDDPFKTVDLVM
jgi:hypothetical protein